MKPARPSVRFPNYKPQDEASATVVEQSPWFVASEAPIGPTLPSFVPPPPAELVALVAPPASPPAPPAPAATFAARPVPPPAPAWALPPVPEVSIIVPERKEFPSYGPVAFDLEAPDQPTAHTHAALRLPQSKRAAAAILCAVAALAVMGSVAGRFAYGTLAAAKAPTAVIQAAAAAPPAAPIVEAAPVAAPEVGPVTAPRRLAPDEIFPPAAAVPVKPAPRQSRADLAHEKRQRQLMAADIARRNAPAPIATMPRGLRPPPPPEVDDLLRAPRMRGERD